MLDYRFGLGTYDEMLGMRRQIRKEREETVYKAMEAKRQIANNMAILGLSIGIIGIIGGGLYLVELLGNQIPYWTLPVILQLLTISFALNTKAIDA